MLYYVYYYILQSGRTALYKMVDIYLTRREKILEASIKAGVDVNAIDKVSSYQLKN